MSDDSRSAASREDRDGGIDGGMTVGIDSLAPVSADLTSVTMSLMVFGRPFGGGTSGGGRSQELEASTLPPSTIDHDYNPTAGGVAPSGQGSKERLGSTTTC